MYPPAHPGTFGHRPALDGIRGLAIIGVLMLHASIWGAVPLILPGGNLAVSIFFVLSGYLITRLLLAEQAKTGRIDLRAFYLRRAARLLPALLLLLPVYVLVFSQALSPVELLLTVGATLLYLSSLVQSLWGAMGNLGWTWSLSVEEHFYAFWPPILRWLLNGAGDRRGGVRGCLRRHPLGMAGAIAALVVVVATLLRIGLAGSVRWNEFAYYSTFTRIDALAIGCLAALVGYRVRVRVPAVAGWAALLVIAWCYRNPAFAIGGDALDLYGLPLCAAAALVLVLTAVQQPASRLARTLAWRPLAHVGKVSYGLYLWNLLPGQTFRLLAGRHPGVIGTISCVLIMLTVVELSYWYVERPLLRWAKARIASTPGASKPRGHISRPVRAARAGHSVPDSC